VRPSSGHGTASDLVKAQGMSFEWEACETGVQGASRLTRKRPRNSIAPSPMFPSAASGGGSQHAVLHFENAVEDIERPVVVRHDDDSGFMLVCDHAE